MIGRISCALAMLMALSVGATDGPPISEADGKKILEAITEIQSGTPERGVAIYRELADRGVPQAQYNLGSLYFRGKGGVKQDFKQALHWYRKAASNGVLEAQFRVGLLYFDGLGIDRNLEEACRWFETATANGHSGAAFNLGFIHERRRDYARAAHYYRIAAEKGNPDGQNNLGVLYLRGLGVPVDKREALRLFRHAAAQGYAQAQCNLGLMYANGEGTERDLAAARLHLKRAAAQGHRVAIAALEELER